MHTEVAAEVQPVKALMRLIMHQTPIYNLVWRPNTVSFAFANII